MLTHLKKMCAWQKNLFLILSLFSIQGATAMEDKDQELIYAAVRGDEAAVRRFIELGANVNFAIGNGFTPLILAAGEGRLGVVRVLLDHGADVNAQVAGLYNIFALSRAATQGRDQIVQLLLERDADVNMMDVQGSTSLMGAAQEGHKKVCQLLIAHGANLYAQDKSGNTALMMAARRGQKEICKLLIDEMIKQEQKQTRIVLYPILKEHKRMGRDTARLVTQQLQESQKTNKAGYKSRAHEEIMKIEDTELQEELLEYLNSL